MRPSHKKIFNRYKNYFILIAVGIGVVILSATLLIPQGRGVWDKYQTLTDKQNQYLKIVSKRTLLESLDFGQTLRFLADAEAALPTEKDAASILIALQNLNAKTLISIDSIDFSPGLVSTESAQKPTDSENPSPQPASTQRGEPASGDLRKGANFMPVTITTRGNKQQLLDFITKVQTSRRTMDIEYVNISYAADSQDFLTADMTLNVFYLPTITRIGGVESELPQITTDEQQLLALLPTMENISYYLLEDITIAAGGLGKTDLFQLGSGQLSLPSPEF